jgi:hypothetical protein
VLFAYFNFKEEHMKHWLLTLGLICFTALQSSMATVVLKPQAPVAVANPSTCSPALVSIAPESAATTFSAAPITLPELNARRPLAEPTLLASNCITYSICADGICRSYTICW